MAGYKVVAGVQQIVISRAVTHVPNYVVSFYTAFLLPSLESLVMILIVSVT
jgi:hypothetical protein